MTSRIALLLVLVTLGAPAGCSATDKPAAAPSAAANAGLGDRTFPSAATVNTRTVAQELFLTPSKNIGCALSASSVRCDIGRREWPSPTKPAGCELDYGNGLVVENTGPARFSCAGDSLLGGGQGILEYGHALRAGDFLCDSESAALRCSNRRSGHGFTLAVESYTMF
jgi:uncharacterized protein DUF6636